MTTARALPAHTDESISSWDRALYAFLAEKERRSGSKRTVQSYSRMLQDFFGRVHKTPDQITSQDVFAWAHGVGLSGREPSAVTINARIGCASSFFRFAIRMGMLEDLARPIVFGESVDDATSTPDSSDASDATDTPADADAQTSDAGQAEATADASTPATPATPGQ